MRALVCHEHGHWRDLQISEIPIPDPERGQVGVRIHAAGLSFANTLAIAGRHQNRTEPPFVPGTEAAGVVTSVNAPETALVRGDRVAVSLSHGAFAEHAVVDAARAFPIPDQLSFAKATLLPTIYTTAWTALRDQAGTGPGDTVLVHGAAGASGLAGVEVARALGARVIACASTAAKRDAAMGAGAHRAVDSSSFRQAVLDETGGRGADVVYDPVGGAVFEQSLRAIAPEGRMLVIGFASGDIPQIPANIVLVKNLTIHGVNWGYHAGWSPKKPTARVSARVDDTYRQLSALASGGDIAPRVHRVLPMEDFGAGFSEIEGRSVIGKIVLAPHGVGSAAASNTERNTS